MTQRQACDQCGQKLSCREAFRRLGNVQGRSVIIDVLTAFVLPLMVFIAALAIALSLLAKRVESAGLRTGFALLSAFIAAAACVAVARIAGRRLNKK